MRQEQKKHIDEYVRRAVTPDPAAVARLTSAEARRAMFDAIVADTGGEQVHRPPLRRRAVLAAAATAAVAGVGVWAARPDPTDTAAPPPPSPDNVPLDRYAASDQRFFDPVRPTAAISMVAPPETLEAALAEATATLVAEVSAVHPGRILHDLQLVDVELRVHEVLRGALRPELGGVVRVEFPASFLPDDIDPVIDRMRAHLPANPAVWLVRWNGEPPPTRKPGAPAKDPTADPTRYRLVHPLCGVFIQGPGHVLAATGLPSYPAYGAQVEGERFALLSDLAARARR
jgi:hypothetical protein